MKKATIWTALTKLESTPSWTSLVAKIRFLWHYDFYDFNFFNDFNVLASFTVFIFALCFSIWLTFVMHLYRRRAEMSRRQIARVELALRRIVPSPSWPRRFGGADLSHSVLLLPSLPFYGHCRVEHSNSRFKWIRLVMRIDSFCKKINLLIQ